MSYDPFARAVGRCWILADSVDVYQKFKQIYPGTEITNPNKEGGMSVPDGPPEMRVRLNGGGQIFQSLEAAYAYLERIGKKCPIIEISFVCESAVGLNPDEIFEKL